MIIQIIILNNNKDEILHNVIVIHRSINRFNENLVVNVDIVCENVCVCK